MAPSSLLLATLSWRLLACRLSGGDVGLTGGRGLLPKLPTLEVLTLLPRLSVRFGLLGTDGDKSRLQGSVTLPPLAG